jgi:DnaK suppressor protein
MTTQDIAEFEALLRGKLARQQARLKSVVKDVTQAHSGDSTEQAQERENDQVVDAIGNSTSLAIEQLNMALRRIEEGSYGVCTRCGASIGSARLAVLPETPTCVACSV